ncbi:MAG TPA: hypothetical protein VNN76_08625 [Bacteroidota bacterium]|nr:hypothetical protein [Bacteroidota bacterium]
MSAFATAMPVVVLKLEHYGSLGIMRSLGRLGIPVHGVDGNAEASASASRFCRMMYVWDIDSEPPQASVKKLQQIACEIGQAILIPTSDETTLFVAEWRKELEQAGFIFPKQDPILVRQLWDKKRMYFLAQKHGIPTAETFFPQSRREVVELIRRIEFPVMLKGINGGLLERQTGKKMVLVHCARELLETYEAMEDPQQQNLMVQEYIPGGDDFVWMFNGYFNSQSECLLGFTGKKIRQNPVHTGMTSLGICLHNSLVAETSKRFMKAIGYQGILDIGYRFDQRDGKYKVLDVNPRIGATFRLFVGQQGMDVARAMYLDLTGQPVPYDEIQVGRKWFVEDKDLRSCLVYFNERTLTVMQWIRSFRGVQEAGYFARDDMKPFFAMLKTHLKKKLLGVRSPKGARLADVQIRKIANASG